MAILSIVTFVGSLIVVPWIISRLPTNYFSDEKRHLSKLSGYHPVVYISLRIIKNLVGIVFFIAGVAMLVLPGQGVLTMLIGMGLTDFPGKYKIERKIVSNMKVFKALNWVRKRAGVLPLQYPEQ